MKILFTQEASPESVRIRLISGPISRFVEKEGKSELHIGYGAVKPLSQRKITLFLRQIIATVKQNNLRAITLDWAEVRKLTDKNIEDKKLGEIAAVAFHMADFDFTVYKKEPEGGFPAINEVTVLNTTKPVQDGFERGEMIAMEVNSCRALANTPGGDMTPRVLGEAAQTITKGTMVRVEVIGKKEIEQIGMGGVIGIAKGSNEEPKFIVMEYRGGDRGSNPDAKRSGPRPGRRGKPVVLIGKGVTFDSGGLQIKPGDHMYEMHMDMSGGAAVMHAVALAAKLKLKVNVIGLVPAVENSASGTAVRPGDILRSLSGRTIEILHTDAEGRVILADAITYAKQYDPKIVVDVATLTGAALVALGTQANAFMTNKESLIPRMQELGEESGDYMWPFPAWEEYEEMTKGTFGDVPNISTAGNSRYGGVIAGGMFLREFAKDLSCPWVHIDMAPRMTSTPGEFLAKGAAGAPVRLLLGIIEEYGR